ncbi:hypothetical protein [Mesonia maritima]|uniref:Uncharacterized protein n=1 Tax=Mesonia maritima TaxID=1793873 RepID=A0ABU1K5S8_9FLAO|nr:hypothetical protein [Mesonia maritima]MDR6300651.1 hypothetical protein [Mesonia maritima]
MAYYFFANPTEIISQISTKSFGDLPDFVENQVTYERYNLESRFEIEDAAAAYAITNVAGVQ